MKNNETIFNEMMDALHFANREELQDVFVMLVEGATKSGNNGEIMSAAQAEVIAVAMDRCHEEYGPKITALAGGLAVAWMWGSIEEAAKLTPEDLAETGLGATGIGLHISQTRPGRNVLATAIHAMAKQAKEIEGMGDRLFEETETILQNAEKTSEEMKVWLDEMDAEFNVN